MLAAPKVCSAHALGNRGFICAHQILHFPLPLRLIALVHHFTLIFKGLAELGAHILVVTILNRRKEDGPVVCELQLCAVQIAGD